MHAATSFRRFTIATLGIAIAAAPAVFGQPAVSPVPDPLAQLMISQPSIEVVSNPVATVSFDPPVVRPGQLSTYRVSFNALDDSVKWPEQIASPPGLALRQSARGQILLYAGNRLVPQTTINLHARATNVGSYVVNPFTVEVYGQPVTVPGARLEVVPANSPVPPPGRRLTAELLSSNIFVGQSVGVRVVIPPSPAHAPQRLAQVKLTGDGFLVDHTVARQSVTVAPQDGQNMVVSVHETRLTPLVAGELRFTAQGFASGGFPSGTVLVPGQALPGGLLGPEVLLDADPVTFTAQPLPRTGELPGFRGAIGNFTCDPPLLSATQAVVGEPLRLSITIRGEGNLARLVPPPAPVSPEWRASSPVASVGVPGVGSVVQISGLRRVVPPGPAITFSYSLTPLKVGPTTTPAIPFSYFDPVRAIYVDLTVPPVAIEVRAGALTNAARLWAEAGITDADAKPPLVLSDLSPSPGRRGAGLLPLQLRSWFVLVQILPLIGFAGIWICHRRRQFLEQHPDVVRRRQARRALRRERRNLQQAFKTNDPARYADTAIRALRVACAPHFPAEPRALVGRDVLELVGECAVASEVVRRFFAVADAAQFSAATADARELMALHAGLEQVLGELEARL